MTARWYVLHVYSGSEKKVAESIREQAALKNIEDKIQEVIVPTEEVVEVRKGTKVNAEHKFFPGYVLIKMEMSDEYWHIVKNTPRVTGFLGSRNKPQPISEAEAKRIMTQMQEDRKLLLNTRLVNKFASTKDLLLLSLVWWKKLIPKNRA